MNKDVRSCYKRSRSGERTAFARIADKVFYTVLTYLILKLLLQEAGFASYAAGLMAICFTVIFLIAAHIVSDIMLDRYIRRDRKDRMRRKFAFDLAMMSDEEFMRLVDASLEDQRSGPKHMEVIQRISPVNADDVLKGCRAARNEGADTLVIAASSKIDDSAKEYAKNVGNMKIVFVSSDELVELMLKENGVDDEAADALFMAEQEEKTAKKKRSISEKFAAQKNFAPYFMCGFALFVLSLFTRFSLYYKLIAVVCVWAGSFKLVRQKLRK